MCVSCTVYVCTCVGTMNVCVLYSVCMYVCWYNECVCPVQCMYGTSHSKLHGVRQSDRKLADDRTGVDR